MSAPVKVYPTVEECHIKNKVTCTMEDCSQQFTSESILYLHIAKTHNNSQLKPVSSREKWYFCPTTNCPWSKKKHFQSLKDLRQHFMKTHTEKRHECPSCNKSFALEGQLLRHSEYCDVWFNCLSCKASYSCYETLKTHCRRKDHKLLNKPEYKVKKLPTVTASQSQPIANDTTFEAIKIVARATQTTSETDKSHFLSVCSVGTQTDHHEEDNCRSMNTQTDIVESRESSCNTSFNIEDFEFSIREHIQTNSSSTQTQSTGFSFPSSPVITQDSIHTDTSDLLSNIDANFFNCNTKTQTDMLFSNEFCTDYYSDMYTQTCDEILSGLSDIQTQTVHDTLRSVESQTLMSSSDRLCPSIFKDIVHTETQTDAEFRQMLEIINS